MSDARPPGQRRLEYLAEAMQTFRDEKSWGHITLAYQDGVLACVEVTRTLK